MPDEYDLIIIGAGPAGSSCAEAAAASGLRVRVFERARFPRTKPCAAGLTSHALELLGDRAEGVIHRRIDTVEMRLTPRVRGTWHGTHTVVATTTRRELDPLLAKRASEAGATVDFGRCVTGIGTARAGVVVTSRDERFTAPFAVLAEGAKGVLRSRLGMPPLELGGAAYVRLYPAWGGGTDSDIGGLGGAIVLDARARRCGYGWVFPKRDHVNVGVCGRERPGPDYLRDLTSLVASLGLTSWRREGPFAGFVPRASHPEDHAHSRVLAVGDAAGLADPVTGEGIGHAVESGRIAAATVAEALSASRAAMAGGACREVEADGTADAGGATDVAGRYRARIAREVMPRLTLLGPIGRRLHAVGPGLIGALLTVRPLASAVERWVPTSGYTAGGRLTIETGRR